MKNLSTQEVEKLLNKIMPVSNTSSVEVSTGINCKTTTSKGLSYLQLEALLKFDNVEIKRSGAGLTIHTQIIK